MKLTLPPFSFSPREKGGYASAWQSSERLGGALGTRAAPRERRNTDTGEPAQGKFIEATDSEARAYGFPDFPMR